MPDLTPFHKRWPNDQVFTVENARILYIPIAKNACSSLKRLMVELSDLPGRDAMLKGDIHSATDKARNGIQLKDRDENAARRLLADPGYLRFTVLREPFDRLVSAYLEKFVVNRDGAGNRETARPVVAAVQGVPPGEADFETGITFRQFAEFILTATDRLDPHWCPQSDYLAEVPLGRLYTIEGLDLLQRDLTRHCGAAVRIDHANRSREGRLETVPGAADRTPAELAREARRLSSESFFDAALRSRMTQRFALDITLHEAVRAADEARRAAEAAGMAETPREPVLPRSALALAAREVRRDLRKRVSLNGLRRALGMAPVARPRPDQAGARPPPKRRSR
jgi:hypothetical protein